MCALPQVILERRVANISCALDWDAVGFEDGMEEDGTCGESEEGGGGMTRKASRTASQTGRFQMMCRAWKCSSIWLVTFSYSSDPG